MDFLYPVSSYPMPVDSARRYDKAHDGMRAWLAISEKMHVTISIWLELENGMFEHSSRA